MADLRVGIVAPSGLQIAGTSLQVFGSILSAREAARGLSFNATEIIREGKLAARRIREEGERVQSAQRVGFSVAGVEISGTPLEVMAETANLVESNALEVVRSSERQAAELRRAARRKKRSGVFGAIGAAIGLFGGPAGAAIGAQIGSEF